MDCIRQIVHALHVGSRAAQKHVGLSGAQLFVLQTLAVDDNMSVNELAQKTHTHQSSASVVISRLIDAKLVSKKVSPDDGRRARLSVTPVGKRLLRMNIVTPQERILEALNRLDCTQLRVFRDLLERLVADAALGHPAAPMFFEKPLARSTPQAQKTRT